MQGDSGNPEAVALGAPQGAWSSDALARALPAYGIGEELGRGAHGVVVAARHRRLGRDVAVKQLLASGADVAARFVAEARLLASLDHPHIVPIFDFVEVDGLCVLVMERLSGGTVQTRTAERGFGAPAACAVVLATCAALEYAHSKGVLHRDIKPQNLLLSADGVVKVADFGIAKLLGGDAAVATGTGLVLGTPAYMAPELVRGAAPSPVVDLYATATVLYELLCGSRPFPPLEDAMAVLYQHASERPVPLLERAPELPPVLARVTDTALRPDPGERYASAGELAAALAAAAQSAWGPDWSRDTGIVLRAAIPVATAEALPEPQPVAVARPPEPSAGVEFRILGRLEVRDDGRVLSLGGAKQRAVLALLLLRAGEVVSTERLVDELWGARPPATAGATVQVYVSRLRKVLPPGTLVTEGRGYRLAVENEAVDARRFERLLAEGRDALAAGDAARAAATLREALGLWRGQALAEFAYERFAQAEIGRLEELQLVALEERVDADLALGRHGELVGEVEGLIAEHPLRERLRGQLMLALYRSGRQAEALEAYQRTRRELVGELGIEPSPALQRLEQAILQHDPGLDAQAAPAPATAPEQPPAGALPSGVVTFLLTDIEGSTQLWDNHREAMAGAVQRHEELVRTTVEASGGHPLAHKGEGDSTLSVFARASEAAAAARRLQSAVAAEEWPDRIELAVRVALHTGEAYARERDYYGPALNRAARLRALAIGGQVLVSSATAELIRDRLPDGSELVELGERKLRGLAREEQVFELGDEGAARSPAGALRVLLVDDQALVRGGFRAILEREEGIEVVGEAADGREAIDLGLRLRPDVVLMDIRMPRLDGLAATRELLRAAAPSPPRVIMVTTFDLDDYVYEALRSGASGFLLKDTPPRQLVEAVRTVAAGEALLSPSVTRRLIESFARSSGPPPPGTPRLETLTEPEMAVFKLLARGLDNARIAAELGVEEAAAMAEIEAVLARLGLPDRVQAVVLAYEIGLIEPGQGEPGR